LGPGKAGEGNLKGKKNPKREKTSPYVEEKNRQKPSWKRGTFCSIDYYGKITSLEHGSVFGDYEMAQSKTLGNRTEKERVGKRKRGKTKVLPSKVTSLGQQGSEKQRT